MSTRFVKLEALRYWCQKVLPTIYDDSLSYYELLNKVVKHLNDVTEGINEVYEYLEDFDIDTNVDEAIAQAVEEIAQEVYDEVINGGHMFDYLTLTTLNPDTTEGKMTIFNDCTHNGLIYGVEFPKPRRVEYLPTSGDYVNPRQKYMYVEDWYKEHPDFDIVCNAGQTGNSVFNGVPWESNGRSGSYYLCFDNNNNPSTISRATAELPISQLSGYKNVIPIWSPIIENGAKFNYTVLSDNPEAAYDYVYLGRHIRTVLVCDSTKWAVIIFDGRGAMGEGYNYEELYSYLSGRGYQNAYNLDGGGSSQIFIGGAPICVGNEQFNYRKMWSVLGMVI